MYSIKLRKRVENSSFRLYTSYIVMCTRTRPRARSRVIDMYLFTHPDACTCK